MTTTSLVQDGKLNLNYPGVSDLMAKVNNLATGFTFEAKPLELLDTLLDVCPVLYEVSRDLSSLSELRKQAELIMSGFDEDEVQTADTWHLEVCGELVQVINPFLYLGSPDRNGSRATLPEVPSDMSADKEYEWLGAQVLAMYKARRKENVVLLDPEQHYIFGSCAVKQSLQEYVTHLLSRKGSLEKFSSSQMLDPADYKDAALVAELDKEVTQFSKVMMTFLKDFKLQADSANVLYNDLGN